jgi:hypothetical protein
VIPPRAALECFLERLDAEVGFAVAKQPDLWANLRRGGDWDLVVADVNRAREVLVTTVGAPVRTVRRSYVVAEYFDWGEIDLLPRLEWKGVELASARAVVAGAQQSSEGWPIARSAHQAVAAWVYPLLAYGAVTDRNAEVARRAAAEDGVELEQILTRLFGPARAAVLVRAARAGDHAAVRPLIPALRFAARRRAIVGRPLPTLRAMGAFCRAELALRARAPIAEVMHR